MALDIEGIIQKLNLKWYRDKEQYSDGNVENDIMEYVCQNEPEDYGKIIAGHYSWPVYYHLTHTRKNILNWYPFKEGASVLEVGCGCGAVTGMLCDKCQKVTAVELSLRRAAITQLRCRDKDNLEVIVGNLNDIEFEEKFDYITLIGVLEYQGTYTDSGTPYRDFLKKIKSFLKEDGKLLIAIENKYGLKYWCGAMEDHTGIPFDGLNQYRFSDGKVKTFSKEELRELLIESGFKKSYFYFPLPDYKLPTVVYSEKYMPRDAALENMIPYYVPSDQSLILEEEKLYKDLIRNKVFDFFANSFLVECSLEDKKEEKVIFALMNTKRQKEYRIGTKIDEAGKVKKFALEDNENIQNHLVKCAKNMEKLKSFGLKVLPYRTEGKELVADYVELPTIADMLCNAAKEKNRESIWDLFDKLLKEIESSSDPAEQKECLIYELGLDEYKEEKNYGKILKEGYVDMIPRNGFMEPEGNFLWFDQEWVLDHIPSSFIFFKGVAETYSSFPELEEIVPISDFLKHYGIDKHLDVFFALNELYMKSIIDEYYAGYHVENRDQDIYRKNIMKFL